MFFCSSRFSFPLPRYRLGNNLVRSHTVAMVMPKLPVYFACRHCEKVYVAAQQRRTDNGHFNCTDCGKQVHAWSGYYSFTDWKPV